MEVDADELLNLVNQAADCLDAGDGAGAKALCQQAIKLYSECEYAWGNLAFAEIQLGNLEAAFTAGRTLGGSSIAEAHRSETYFDRAGEWAGA